jgi:hypothetical protein
MKQSEKTFQLRCKCGKVKHVLVQGQLIESEKLCDNCGEVITEQNILEVKQEFLLERG